MRHYSLIKLLSISSLASTNPSTSNDGLILALSVRSSSSTSTSYNNNNHYGTATSTTTTRCSRGKSLHMTLLSTSETTTKIKTTSNNNNNERQFSPNQLQQQVQQFASRRKVLTTTMVGLFGGGTSLSFIRGDDTTIIANALDMDAFMNSQLESDTKNCNPKTDSKCIPKLTPDEAMCKYGQSGDARGEACRRLKEAGQSLPSSGQTTKVKSLGGAYAM